MMKKILTGFCAALLLTLSGCGGTLHYAPPAETEGDSGAFAYTHSDDIPPAWQAQTLSSIRYHDGYLYIMPGTGKPIYRMNVKTGNVTCVCADPLCTHDGEQCALYGLFHTCYITDSGDLCFHRMTTFPIRDVLGNIIDREHINDFVITEEGMDDVRTLETYGSSTTFTSEIYDGDYRYYSGQVYDPETEETTYGLLRMNLVTGEKIWFGAAADEDGNAEPIENAIPSFLWEDRLYFCDTEGLFSLDRNGENRIDHVRFRFSAYDAAMTDGEYIYIRNHEAGEVVRIPLNGGEEETVAAGIQSNFCFTERYIYYLSGEKVILGKADIPGYAADEVVLSGGELHRCLHDGSENTVVYTFSGEWAGVRPMNDIVVGNYYYCFYSRWTDADGDGVYEEGDSGYSTAENGKESCTILRIDLTTGETTEIEVLG